MTSQSRAPTPSILLGAIISTTIVLTASADLTNCVTPPAGLAAWWRAEGNAVAQAWTNNGTLVGNPTYGAGRVGQAFVFDGTNGYVSAPASTSLNVGLANGFTIECWIKPADISGPRPLVE